MTEQEFWSFLKQRGKVNMLSGYVDSGNPTVQAEIEYINGHSLLPKDYDKLSESDIVDIANLLFQDVNHRTKEGVIMLLAHQVSETALTILTKYCLSPDPKLASFAKIALDECLMWNK